MKLSFKALAMDVLVVDDEPISRQMAAQSIESVVCGWSMPEMDGAEHLRRRDVFDVQIMEDEFREIHLSHPPVALPKIEKWTAQLVSV